MGCLAKQASRPTNPPPRNGNSARRSIDMNWEEQWLNSARRSQPLWETTARSRTHLRTHRRRLSRRAPRTFQACSRLWRRRSARSSTQTVATPCLPRGSSTRPRATSRTRSPPPSFASWFNHTSVQQRGRPVTRVVASRVISRGKVGVRRAGAGNMGQWYADCSKLPGDRLAPHWKCVPRNIPSSRIRARKTSHAKSFSWRVFVKSSF